MTPTTSPPNTLTGYITFDLNLASWLIAEAKLRFLGARFRDRQSKGMVFLFDDPDQQGLAMQEEFNFGRAAVNVKSFVTAKEMLIKLVQDNRRGGFNENPR